MLVGRRMPNVIEEKCQSNVYNIDKPLYMCVYIGKSGNKFNSMKMYIDEKKREGLQGIVLFIRACKLLNETP